MFVPLFLMFMNFASCRGIEISFFSDSTCETVYGHKNFAASKSWFLLDTCITDYLEPKTPSSSIYVVERNLAGVLVLREYFFQSSTDCSGTGHITRNVTFVEYFVCEQIDENLFGISNITDFPSKVGHAEVAVSKYGFDSEKPTCKKPIYSVDFFSLEKCVFNGHWFHPVHTKVSCSDGKFEVEKWNKLISSCSGKPDEAETHQVGSCDKGYVYNCEN